MTAGPKMPLCAAALVWIVATAAPTAAGGTVDPPCEPATGWSSPGGGQLEVRPLFEHLARQNIVMLGERHDDAAHHRWQLETLRALHRRQPDIVLGLEMFPRRVQPVLDAWVRGELDETAFLEQSDWATVWRFDPELYLPLLRYARDHGLPLRALNVDASLTRAVSRQGLAAVAPHEREGVTPPAAPSPRYVEWLGDIHARHHPPMEGNREPGRENKRRHFVEAQLVWDRAFAQGLYDAHEERPEALIVALIGSGHLAHGFGVPHQLDDLGVTDHATLLPWNGQFDCSELVRGLAHAIYRLDAPDEAAPPAP